MRSIGPCILAAVLIAPGAGCGSSMNVATTTNRSTQEQLPTAATYAATCRLVGSWCKPIPGSVPTALRRALHLPKLDSGSGCPTSSGRRFSNSQFGGTALGSGPVEPLIATLGGDPRRGILAFIRAPATSPWWGIKTLWFSYPRYQGPVFIRGRRLDGLGKVIFGEGPSVIDPQLPPEPTINGMHGWREWPGGTFIRSFGCYAWQIDGINFSTAIVFKAIRRGAG